MLVDAGVHVKEMIGVDCPDQIRPVMGLADYDSVDISLLEIGHPVELCGKRGIDYRHHSVGV